jgi:putative PEP-CTERM system TPR-repeat lipoprotein
MNFFKSIVCASVLLAVSACGNNETSQTHIAQAEKLLIEKQHSSAIIALKNAIKLDTKNAQARFLLGQLYLSLGDANSAVKELTHANELQYAKNNVLPLLARAYMLLESDDEILLLDEQAEQLTGQSKAQFLAYKTLASLRLGDEKTAIESAKLAFSISESYSYSLLANAYVEFVKRDMDKADSLVNRILVDNGNNVDALMLQGKIASVQKDYIQAISSFKRYFELQPKFTTVQLFIADSLLKNRNFQEAESIADSILDKISNQPFFQYIKAMARFEDKDYKEASHYAGLALNSNFKPFSLKMVAGASAFYLQKYEQSNIHLSSVVKQLPAEHPARKMLAISQLKLGFIDDISETLDGYDSSSKEGAQFLTNLSLELYELGAFEKAKEVAKQAAKAAKAGEYSAEQTAREGILKLMMNDPSGTENLELALQQNPELVSAELALAFASIKSGDLTRANKIAKKWLERYPEKAGGYNLKATVAFKQNQIEKGKIALEKSLALEPNNVYALLEMIRLASYQKDIDRAQILAEQALAAHPKNIKVLNVYLKVNNNDQSLAIIKKAQQENRESLAYGILLAEAFLQQKEYKQASTVLDSYTLNAKTPKRYWQLLLIANSQLKDGKDTFLILEQWLKNNPYHLEPTLLMADYWLTKKLPNSALSTIKQGMRQHPNNQMLSLTKMQILLNYRKLKDAKILRKELDQFSLNEDFLAGIDGKIFLLEGNYLLAIPKLRQQFEAKPNEKSAILLAYALEGNKQHKDSIAFLEKYSAKNKENSQINLHLAELYLINDYNKSIETYEKLIVKEPKNVIALNNLSWLYMEQGKFKQALEYCEKAYELAAKNPNVVDTYAQVLLKSGNKVEALVKAEQAYTLSKSENVDIALNFAETLLANDDKEQAKNILLNISAKTEKQKTRHQKLTSQLI